MRAPLLLLLLLVPTTRGQQPVMDVASINPSGNTGNRPSFTPVISENGSVVVFASFAFDLVAGDTNFFPDVFVRDRTSGQTVRASVDSSGGQANWVSWMPAVSADGQVVAFLSLATNLVPNDTNLAFDAFVRDLQSGTTTRVSVSSSGAEANSGTTFLAISGDGRWVAFDGDASNLVPGDTNGASDVFLHDRQTGQTTRVSVGPGGIEADGPSFQPALSRDGRFVAFTSGAGNLVAGDVNGVRDVFVHDRLTGVTALVSVAPGGAPGDGESSLPSLSYDGRFVAFESLAADIVPGDANGVSDVFVRDLATGTTTLVSQSASGARADRACNIASISGDGRFVTFSSLSTTLHPATVFGWSHVFLRDLQMGLTDLVSVDASGTEADENSYVASISGDGRVIAFETDSTSLVSGDLNSQGDVYVRTETAPLISAACFGDGTGAACPCGNSSSPGSLQGCLHSLGTGGSLRATGRASLANDSFVLAGTWMPDSFALYFQGTGELLGGAGAAFGDGKRCAGGSVVRLGAKLNAGGASQYPAAGDPPVSVGGVCTPGSLRVYQVWFRNAAAFCTGATFNLTNTILTTWAP